MACLASVIVQLADAVRKMDADGCAHRLQVSVPFMRSNVRALHTAWVDMLKGTSACGVNQECTPSPFAPLFDAILDDVAHHKDDTEH